MNEKLNLVEILKDCPSGTKLYSTVFGEVEFIGIKSGVEYQIVIRLEGLPEREYLTTEGKLFAKYNGECTLFPSREQRDWSKFNSKKKKKERFDSKTLKPFDKVLVRDIGSEKWSCGLFSYIVIDDGVWRYSVGEFLYTMCIPYNDETKHLVGTTEEAPEYYRYWED